MELANYLVEDGRRLAEQFLVGEIELPVQISGLMWLALPDDKSVLAFGAVSVMRGQESIEFKIGTRQL